jgi:hypothetical protein
MDPAWPPPLASLPDECLRHVLSLLSLHALGSTARTCRSLRDLAAEPSLWRQLFTAVWQAEPPASARPVRQAFIDRLTAYRKFVDLRMDISGPASKYLLEQLVGEDGDGGGGSDPPPAGAPCAGAGASTGASEPGPVAAGAFSSLFPAAAPPGPSPNRLVQELRWTGSGDEAHGDHSVGVACLSSPLPSWPVGVPTRFARQNPRPRAVR